MTEAKKVVNKTVKKAATEDVPELEVLELTDSDTSKIAKAGKRSTKALAEIEAKVAKEKRKEETTSDAQATKKSVAPTTRSKIERSSKKYREVITLIEKGKVYELAEALDLATKTSTTKFDSTVELHINLGVDPKQADQNVRDTVVLPAGTGKVIRVAVLAEDDDAKKAKAAGADIAGADSLFAELDKENIEFDVLIATPLMMPKLGKYARLLGPRGLMPNPKSGTVTTDVATAVVDARAGKVEYRVDQAGIVHLGIGKVSFGKDKLVSNANAIMSSIKSAKPSSLKNVYIKSIYITTSMGPSIRVNTST